MKNQICHFEIGCRDRAKAADFYSKMFDWKMEEQPEVTRIRTGGDIGGHINALGHEPHTYTLFYIMVDHVEAALARAASLGGKRIVGPVLLPGNREEFGWFADPEGNMIGVYGEAKK